jgi:hypothetical protein
MPTLDKKQDSDMSKQAGAKLEKALFEKRDSIAGALEAAPEGRHQLEHKALEELRQQLTGQLDAADREKVDALFEQQHARLDQVQRAELELGQHALESTGSLESLSRAVDAIGELHNAAHQQLAEQQSALATALADDDQTQRTDLINAVLADLADQAKLDASFTERAGMPWTAAEMDARLAAGAIGEQTATSKTGDMEAAPSTSDELDADTRHKRGNFGERTATDALAELGFSILDYKPDIDGTTKPGIDIVAMKQDEQNRDVLYLIDNKALTRDGNVNSVSALTTSLDDRADREGNLTRVRKALEQMTDEATRSAEQIDVARRALAALDEGRVALAVTNANLAKNDRILEDVSERLKKQHGIEFIDVMRDKAAVLDEAAKTEEERS